MSQVIYFFVEPHLAGVVSPYMRLQSFDGGKSYCSPDHLPTSALNVPDGIEGLGVAGEALLRSAQMRGEEATILSIEQDSELHAFRLYRVSVPSERGRYQTVHGVPGTALVNDPCEGR